MNGLFLLLSAFAVLHGPCEKTRTDGRLELDYPIDAVVDRHDVLAIDVYLEELLPFRWCRVCLRDESTWTTCQLNLKNIDPRRWQSVRLKLADFKGESGATPKLGNLKRLRLSVDLGADADRAEDVHVELRDLRVVGPASEKDVTAECGRDSGTDPIPMKRGERRLAWDHSHRGICGRNWDVSARQAKECGFTDMIVNLAWAGCAAYRSDVVDSHPDVGRFGDQLEQCLAACRKHGLRLHAWLVTYRIFEHLGKANLKPVFEAYERDGRLQVGRDLKITDRWGYWICPSHPDNRRMVQEMMLELVRKGVDGIHFDYVRYADFCGCYCQRCRALFERKLGRRVSNWPADATGVLREDWLAFRAGLISEQVRDVSVAAHALRPSIEVSAAVFYDPRKGGESYRSSQDWRLWCAEGWLDFVCPMDYCGSSVRFRDTIEMQKNLSGKAKMYPGIGFSCWPKDGKAFSRLREQVGHCRETGFGGWTVFNLDDENLVDFLSRFAGSQTPSVQTYLK